jgi:hypothetical protein
MIKRPDAMVEISRMFRYRQGKRRYLATIPLEGTTVVFLHRFPTVFLFGEWIGWAYASELASEGSPWTKFRRIDPVPAGLVHTDYFRG